ncbi:hypothetical protein HDU91_006895 [Kappamyces sp. JEL0680]|nr:hypothetical protein HDU91_006895 [Kappamyces sp. JEL0680]
MTQILAERLRNQTVIPYTDAYQQPMGYLYTIMALCGVILGFGALLHLYRKRFGMNPIMSVYFCIALFDILSSLVVFIQGSVNIAHGAFASTYTMCLFSGTIHWLSCEATLVYIFLIAFNRYCAVILDRQFSWTETWIMNISSGLFVTLICTFPLWTGTADYNIAILQAMAHCGPADFSTERGMMGIEPSLTAVVLIGLGIPLISFFYYSMYTKYSKEMNKLHANRNGVTQLKTTIQSATGTKSTMDRSVIASSIDTYGSQGKRIEPKNFYERFLHEYKTDKEMRLFYQSSLIVGAYLICWGPFGVFFFLTVFMPGPAWLEAFADVCAILNAIVDALMIMYLF